MFLLNDAKIYMVVYHPFRVKHDKPYEETKKVEHDKL